MAGNVTHANLFNSFQPAGLFAMSSSAQVSKSFVLLGCFFGSLVGTGLIASNAFAQVPIQALQLRRAISAASFQDASDLSIEMIEDVAADGEVVAAAAADPEATEKAKEEARKKVRLQKINALVFDRRPSAILKLWAEQGKPAKDATEPKEAEVKEPTEEPAVEDVAAKEEAANKEESVAEEAGTQQADGEAAEPAEVTAEPTAEPTEEAKELAQFEAFLKEMSDAVTLGKWEHFAEQIKDETVLAEEEGIAIYRQMLKQLTADMGMDFSQVVGLSDEMQNFMQSMMGNRRNNPAQAFAEKHSISFADIVAIIRSAPETLEDSDVGTLAQMLRRTLETGSQLEDFVTALEQGGEELLSREQAGLLLSRAACDEFTPKFLVAVDEAKAAGNAKTLNLWARHFMAMFDKERQESFREQAWEVALAILDLKDVDEDQRSEALTRAVSLAPKLKEELGQAWLQDSFSKYPERGQEILAAIGTATAQRLSQMPQDGQERLRNLQLQSSAVKALLATNPEIDSQWSAILNLLASNWLQEANVSYSYSQASRFGPGMRRDMYGNIYYADPSESDDGTPQPLRMGQIVPVEPDQILETAPQGVWFDSIQSSIRPQYTMMLGRLWLKVNEDSKAFPYIESLASTHPDTARELAEEFLRVWTKNHNPNQESQRTNYYMFMYGYETKADKIPLTRSKQQRNLKELSEWVLRLRELPIADKVEQSLLVRAFMTCHSVAEVYNVEDIEKIFGSWEGIEPGTMAGLIQAMRGNLSGLWRDPNVQRDSGTKRKKSDIQAEVTRGYAVAQEVLNKALETYPGNWQLLLAKASMMHDENDLLQEVSPSSEFSKRREAAFDVFAEAADSYVAVAADLPEREQKNDVFDYWFYAALGATDLAGVSEKNQLAPSEIDRILESMNGLPGEMGKRHRDRFANSLFNRMSAVSPSCKARYLDAGFKIVGDNPLADEARQVHDYYKDLVTELELVARIDGGSTVGHAEPFSVYVDLRHTKELEREAGGFAKYLQNQNNAYYAYNYGRPTENYRDKFQDAAIAALQEQFEVLSVTFNHDDVKSRPAGNDDWRVTPYAHLLLKARGPEVDKLPALRLDLDFLDTSGYVVLPIASAPLSIDASTDSKASGAIDDLKIVQVLDERQSKDGKLIVEAKVTARGLVPNLDTLLDVKQAGFELADVEDSGVSVVEFDKESTDPVIISERTFTMKYSPVGNGTDAPTRFAFATPLVDVKDASYQRYVDADLEEVESTVALVEEYSSPYRNWMIGGLCALAGCVMLGGLVFALRGRSTGDEVVQQEVADVTPFNLLARLKATYADESIPVEKRNRLRDDIVQVERHYFAESTTKESLDLTAIAKRWE